MNHHPIVLQKRIEAIPILYELHVIGTAKNGRFHFVSKQNKRAASYFVSKEINADQHGSQRELGKTHYSHYRPFPVFCTPDQNPAQYCLPKTPKHKAALLPFPKTTQEVFYL